MQNLVLYLEAFLRQRWKGLYITSGTQGRRRQVGRSLWTGLYQCVILYVVRVAAAAAVPWLIASTLFVRNHGLVAIVTLITAAVILVVLMAHSQVTFGVWSNCNYQIVNIKTEDWAGFANDLKDPFFSNI